MIIGKLTYVRSFDDILEVERDRMLRMTFVSLSPPRRIVSTIRRTYITVSYQK